MELESCSLKTVPKCSNLKKLKKLQMLPTTSKILTYVYRWKLAVENHWIVGLGENSDVW